MNCSTDSTWHLDKKVPIVIILTMGIQVAGGLWFISKRDARVLAVETAHTQQRDRDERQDKASDGALRPGSVISAPSAGRPRASAACRANRTTWLDLTMQYRMPPAYLSVIY